MESCVSDKKNQNKNSFIDKKNMKMGLRLL